MKTITVLFAAILVCLLSACQISEKSPERVWGNLDEIAGKIGQSQITTDQELLGSRESEDGYTGSYSAKIVSVSGRDVIFGGGSIKERELVISGTISAESGSAKIRVRQNDEVNEYETENTGEFYLELSLYSGGNYIMIDYKDFSGTVEMTSVYQTV